MIQQLPGRDGTLLFSCENSKSLIPSTPKSNPWIMETLRIEDLDPIRDVYILYTDNSHFSFAKPVPPSPKA
jgi:hypothetical protein